MCPPVVPALVAGIKATGAWLGTSAGLATLSVASAGVGLYAQNSTAKAQASAIKFQQDAERQESLERNTEELGQRVRASREARARARVAAGESGAMGASFAASMNQSLQDQNMDAALVQKNVAFSNRATDDRANTALSSIRSPSSLEAGLTIAGAGVSGYSSGQRLEDKRNGKSE